MSISSLGSKIKSALHVDTSRTEKKALPTNPFQQPAIKDSFSMDSFEAGGRTGSRPSGGNSLSGDVFQSATQGPGAQAALDLLGGIGEKLTNFAEDLGELLSAGGPEGEMSTDGPDDEMSADGPDDEMSADGPDDEMSADGPDDEMSADGPDDAPSASGPESM